MRPEDVAAEIVIDLLRSAWIVERARAEVYRLWAGDHARFEASARRAARRAEIVGRSLRARGGPIDDHLVEPHAAWIRRLAGDRFGEIAFADIFVVRLGDWVDAHAASFLVDGASELQALGAEERDALAVPDRIPPPPPYEPVPPPEGAPLEDIRFRFAILGDLHVGSRMGERAARAAVDDVNASGAEVVIQLGDITDHGNVEEFELAAKVLAGLETTWATMIGNHDIYSDNEERLAGREYFRAFFGREPDGLLFEHGGVRFAVLDSAENGTSPFGPFNLVTGTFMEGRGGGIVRGSFTPPQHDILAEVAAPRGEPAFVFLHHPPQPFTGFPPVLFGLREQDSGRLHATCDSGNVWGVFAGHTHRNALTRWFGTVPALEVGVPRDYPYGYAVVDVTDHGYRYRFVQLSDEELLREMYAGASEIHRRYALGAPEERAFGWLKP